MNLSSLLALWITLWQFRHLAAEELSEIIDLPDHKYPALYLDLPKNQYGAACPASTEREKSFNDEVSITGNSVFLRNIYRVYEAPKNICDKPFEPGIIYDLKNRKYQIGYEVYYKENEIRTKYYSTYNRYKPVNINYEVINASKNLSQYVVRIQDDGKNKFSFANESETLVFKWIPTLTVASSGSRRQIIQKPSRSFYGSAHLESEYEGYKLEEPDMKVYLVSDENHFELWTDQHSYGEIKMSQLIPAMYFRTPSEKLASYRYMNMVPIWKSIADEQLKKVDIYLQAVIDHLKKMEPDCWKIDYVSFGTSGVLEEPFNKQKMYFSDTKNHRQIPIPKIIYRMIEGGQNGGVFNAIIVIHNNPTDVSDDERICTKEDEVSGWEAIKNDDPRTGLTYVCHYHFKKVIPSGKSVICTNDELSRPIQLDKWSYITSGSNIVFYDHLDERLEINEKFQELMNQTLGI